MSIRAGRLARDVFKRLVAGKTTADSSLTIAEATDGEINSTMPGPLDSGQMRVIRGFGRERLKDAPNIAGEASEEGKK